MASVEVLAGPERRRRWSVEQKQAIVAAAFKPGAVVRDVARQADVTSSLIYRWRRDLRAAANGFAQWSWRRPAMVSRDRPRRFASRTAQQVCVTQKDRRGSRSIYPSPLCNAAPCHKASPGALIRARSA